MIPPWEKFPELEYGSAGWRMGAGEAYIDQYLTWFYAQGLKQASFLIDEYQPPAGWREMLAGHIEKIESGKQPWEQ